MLCLMKPTGTWNVIKDVSSDDSKALDRWQFIDAVKVFHIVSKTEPQPIKVLASGDNKLIKLANLPRDFWPEVMEKKNKPRKKKTPVKKKQAVSVFERKPMIRKTNNSLGGELEGHEGLALIKDLEEDEKEGKRERESSEESEGQQKQKNRRKKKKKNAEEQEGEKKGSKKLVQAIFEFSAPSAPAAEEEAVEPEVLDVVEFEKEEARKRAREERGERSGTGVKVRVSKKGAKFRSSSPVKLAPSKPTQGSEKTDGPKTATRDEEQRLRDEQAKKAKRERMWRELKEQKKVQEGGGPPASTKKTLLKTVGKSSKRPPKSHDAVISPIFTFELPKQDKPETAPPKPSVKPKKSPGIHPSNPIDQMTVNDICTVFKHQLNATDKEVESLKENRMDGTAMLLLKREVRDVIVCCLFLFFGLY